MKLNEYELKRLKKERMEEIDKWLDNEYGVSYTSLEEIHDWLVDENMKKDKEIERLNIIINKLEKYANRRIDELKEQENKLNIKLTSELNELYTFLGMIIGLKGDSISD